jgi:glutaredoxin 3
MAVMADVEIYKTPWCPYCVAENELLEERQVAYRDVDVSGDPARRAEAQTRSGRRTVPQIFIDGTSIGGYEELAGLDADGRLQELLHAGA